MRCCCRTRATRCTADRDRARAPCGAGNGRFGPRLPSRPRHGRRAHRSANPAADAEFAGQPHRFRL